MVLKIKRLGLSAFFILLVLSIGLVSINLPLSSYAQSNALSQNGIGDAEQGTRQEQSSEQGGHVYQLAYVF